MNAEDTIKTMTMDQLKQGNPELAAALVAEGRAAGFEAGKAEGLAEGRVAGHADGLAKGLADGKAEGAAAERERIKSVESQALPGHAALIEQLKFDGKTTGPEAAVKILQVEKESRLIHRDKLRTDVVEPIRQGVTQPGTELNPDAASSDEKAKKRDQKIAEHQKEHGTDYKTAAFAVSRAHPDLFTDR